MKNKYNVLLILAVILFIALGCSMITDKVQKSVTGDQKSTPTPTADNRSLPDKAVDDATDTETTGIPECDEVIKIFSDQSQSKDDNWASRATKNFIFSQIKKSFKQSIEENKGDKTKMAENCKEYKKQLETELQKDKDNNKNSDDK